MRHLYMSSRRITDFPRMRPFVRSFYWFVSDYADVAAEERVREMVCPGNNFCGGNSSELRTLRICVICMLMVSSRRNEVKMAEFMNSLPEETVHTMADTYTEGYRIGFEVTGKDLSKKAVGGCPLSAGL